MEQSKEVNKHMFILTKKSITLSLFKNMLAESLCIKI